MNFTFVVTVHLDRVSGKFASKDEAREEIRDALESADPGDLTLGDDSEYSVAVWDVTEQ
jgi:hypothetical protein